MKEGRKSTHTRRPAPTRVVIIVWGLYNHAVHGSTSLNTFRAWISLAVRTNPVLSPSLKPMLSPLLFPFFLKSPSSSTGNPISLSLSWTCTSFLQLNAPNTHPTSPSSSSSILPHLPRPPPPLRNLHTNRNVLANSSPELISHQPKKPTRQPTSRRLIRWSRETKSSSHVLQNHHLQSIFSGPICHQRASFTRNIQLISSHSLSRSPPPSENDTQSLLPKSSFGVLLQGAGRRLIRLLHALDRIPIQVAWSRGEEPSLPAPTRAMAILRRLVTVTWPHPKLHWKHIGGSPRQASYHIAVTISPISASGHCWVLSNLSFARAWYRCAATLTAALLRPRSPPRRRPCWRSQLFSLSLSLSLPVGSFSGSLEFPSSMRRYSHFPK